MPDDQYRQTISRRTALKQLGAAGILGGVGFSSVGSAQASSGKGPVRARGNILNEYTFNQDTIVHEEWYISSNLEERYGSRRIRFEHLEMDRNQLEEATGHEFPDEGKRVYRSELDKLVGTEDEWREHYQKQLAAEIGEEASIRSKSEYTGPIWEYKKSGSGQYTKSAPINVVWETPYNSFIDVYNEMKSSSRWNDPGICAEDRYIHYVDLYNSYFIKQDAQVSTQNFCGDQQDHVRMWQHRSNFGGSDGQFEIGSIHHDPYGHGYGCDIYGTFTFDPPESRLKDWWRNNTLATVGRVNLDNARSWSGCKDSNDRYAGYINW
ncbi:hypothetical protein EGH21_17480 [Halomicroarcula sp. F13]|jgi:hypothetical protein|uniref:Secreted protein n=1 Tax=Haloarcula rubra TaxID=2487747 RepID=A0AAW4PU47_9EURY|nr:hypothetical protein [Halomicroarcula rubra]MBX0324821.1 hypothetical protein [Halomicroarcula rubra]